MNIYSKDYNIYLSRTENMVTEKILSDHVSQQILWNIFVDTINNNKLWLEAQ